MSNYLDEVLGQARGAMTPVGRPVDQTKVDILVKDALDRIPQIVAASAVIQDDWVPLLEARYGDADATAALGRVEAMLKERGIATSTARPMLMQDFSTSLHVKLSSLLASVRT